MSDAPLRHLRIMASAGSGKTYRLTRRYIDLLERGAAPGSILASTFTRLAAGEIRDRVLGALADAAACEACRGGACSEHDPSRQHRALPMLRAVTTALDRLQIRTLDSFFAMIARSFAAELHLPPVCEVVDEPLLEPMRLEALQQVLDDQGTAELTNLLRLLTQGASERSVWDTIRRTVVDLEGLHRQAVDGAWACVPFRAELNDADLDAAVRDLERLEPATQDRRILAAHANAIRLARDHDWESFISVGLGKVVFNDQETYYRVPLDDATLTTYRELTEHAGAVLVNRVARSNLAARDLLDLTTVRLDELKRRRGRIGFSDLVRTIVDAPWTGSLEAVCYRLDASLSHVLLDEFQDTSVPQWQALWPLLRELTGDETTGRTLFCVGDVKQSIYGWREAEPRLLEHLPQLLFGDAESPAMDRESLTASWRSATPIIELVNDVFESLDDNPALEAARPTAEAWSAVFERHSTMKTKLPGFVSLRTGPGGGDADECLWGRCRRAAAAAAQMHAAAPERSIAVLVRTNTAMSRCLYEFSPDRLDLPAGGRGGGPLTDAAPVNAMLDLLRLADHPGDTVAAFNVARSPLGEALSIPADLASSRRAATRGTWSRLVRRDLQDRGFAATLGAWQSAVWNRCSRREAQRLAQLTDLARAHDARPSLRADEFVRLAEAQRVNDARPAPIQVMTIHQAKGLEFDIVLLPDLDRELAGAATPAVVFERDQDAGPIIRLSRHVRAELRARLPELESMYDQERQRRVYDSLCLLYVALTRARQGLAIWVDPLRRTKKGDVSTRQNGTMAHLLRDALGPFAEPGLDDPDAELMARGDPAAVLAAGPPSSTASSEPEPLRPVIGRRSASGERPRRGVAASPSAEVDADEPLSTRLVLPSRDALDRGVAWHRLYEAIEWLEDFEPDAARLASLIRRLLPRRDEGWIDTQVAGFLESLRQPTVRRLMSRGDREAVTVERELPFAVLVNDDVQSGVIDRLVLDRGDAEIIDFKTDEITSPERLQERGEHYRRQLRSYRRAVAESYGLDPSRIACRLLFVGSGSVFEIDGASSP